MGSHAPVPPSAEPTVTYSSGRLNSSAESPVGPPPEPDFRLLHFNDVYHLDASSAEPVGGISRFMTAVNEYRNDERYQGQGKPELVTLFSGDVFNPSLESSVTKGSHMVPILNKIGTQCACVGNHDLDFGVLQFQHLTSKCAFPWLLANVLDPALGENVPIGNAGRTHMITTANGLKIGLLGLGEREWLETINALPPNLIYRSATEVAKELVPELRAQGADLIVALTHMREPNDHKLARQMDGEIDIILGGHDHFYAHSLINGTHVLRSGSDFKNLSYLEVRRPASPPTQPGQPKWDVDIWRRDIYSSIPRDPPTDQLVDKLTSKLKKSLEKPIGFSAAPLDARFTTVRLRESNIGNFVCDIMRLHYHADIAIMAAGTIRGDQIYPPGPIRVKDVTDCFPFEDPVVVIKVKGQAVWDALENGVSLFPALEGRFPQVSNIKFVFDPSLPPGKRVTSVEVGGEPIDLEKTYTMSTRGYMARGKDGYTSLLVQPEGGECEEVVSEENGILISMMLRQYFMALKALDKWAFWGAEEDRHWGKVVKGVDEYREPSKSLTSTLEPKTGDGCDKETCVIDAEAKKDEQEEPTPAGQDGAGSSTPLSSWKFWTPAKLRERRSTVKPLKESQTSVGDTSASDSESSGGSRPSSRVSGRDADVKLIDREMRIMRRVARKWCRLAGVQSKACDCLDEGEFDVPWTKAVAPRVEGRIVEVVA
ncbi:hypothetical protein NEUTE1DRAFT_128227 [Neurospora tetrasperma FGSC 2508]|uniref:Metallo-dependent phosphatase n=1 Tax=Neurospora tetrasperma (strain FGSC 2508 / ATCC MYA-4615 / P0657) TaxID=510951 RepID=F8MG34_NEUT8|nr:uncharacterized protein NEUTE1DRAFT_128227 [Neurospora tetrasperma FGSC 2508]EGO58562.1 hypothetical protein NEUTE1DRAFT_128227 [Neurospora tetrasperma FGSC 2508]EGZ72630.1 Metallo-dependent phosphatase [Neurospora tetrasperma FGSC 2509]